MAPRARRRPVAVIGLGCIGGSLARALGAQGVDVRAWSSSSSDRERAARAGVCVTGDEGDGGAAAATGASQIVLAVPVSSIASAARAALMHAAPDSLVLHVGGLQRADSLRLDDVLRRRVLGTHPLAGSHNSGFDASRPDMFVGCSVSIESRAPAESRSTAEWLWRTVGATRIEYRDAEQHDRLMAWVSHLPQLTATALAATLAEHGVDATTVGPGARDTTRLAASNSALWRDLVRGSPREMAFALDALAQTLMDLRDALAADDGERAEALWEAGRLWRTRAEDAK